MNELTGIDRASRTCGDEGLHVEPQIDLIGKLNEVGRALESGTREEARERGLSFEKYQRMQRRLRSVYASSTAIELQARAEIDLRRRAERSDLPLLEYIRQGQALIDHTHARLEAVRSVLPKYIAECRGNGLSGFSLWRAVFAELTTLCRRFWVPQINWGALYTEFAYPCLTEGIDEQGLACPSHLFPNPLSHLMERVESATTDDASGSPVEVLPRRPKWDRELHRIVNAYLFEWQQAGVEVPIVSIYKKARVNKSDFYKWIAGKIKRDTPIDRRIRKVCQIEKPH